MENATQTETLKAVYNEKGDLVGKPLFRDDHGLMMYVIGEEVYYLESELAAKGAEFTPYYKLNPFNIVLGSDTLVNTSHLNGSLVRLDSVALSKVAAPVFTYFAVCQKTKTVKIGISNNPRSRLGTLQTSHPYVLSLDLILAGDQEKALHEQFKSDRLSGEWFDLSDSINAFVASNKQS